MKNPGRCEAGEETSVSGFVRGTGECVVYHGARLRRKTNRLLPALPKKSGNSETKGVVRFSGRDELPLIRRSSPSVNRSGLASNWTLPNLWEISD